MRQLCEILHYSVSQKNAQFPEKTNILAIFREIFDYPIFHICKKQKSKYLFLNLPSILTITVSGLIWLMHKLALINWAIYEHVF